MPELLEIILGNKVHSHSEETETVLIDSLLGWAYLELRSPSGNRNIAIPSDEVVRLLERRLPELQHIESRIRIATRLLNLDTDSEVAIGMFRAFMGDEKVLEGRVGQFYFGTMPNLAAREAVGTLLPQLRNIYDNRVLVGELTRYFKGKRLEAFRDEMAASDRHKDISDDILDSKWTKSMMIFNIGELGIHGESALEWLDDIAAGDSPQKSFAAEAADKIRVDIEDGKKTTTDKER